jgi:hypothetical protein
MKKGDSMDINEVEKIVEGVFGPAVSRGYIANKCFIEHPNNGLCLADGAYFFSMEDGRSFQVFTLGAFLQVRAPANLSFTFWQRF